MTLGWDSASRWYTGMASFPNDPVFATFGGHMECIPVSPSAGDFRFTPLGTIQGDGGLGYDPASLTVLDPGPPDLLMHSGHFNLVPGQVYPVTISYRIPLA